MSFLAGGEGGRDRTVVLGELELVEEGHIVGWPLAMTDDASVVACQLTAVDGGKACIAVNGRRGKAFDAVGSPVLSADGAVVAYRAQRGNEHFVVVGDRIGPAFDFVKDPALAPDGRTVAYAAARGKRWFLIVDGEQRELEHEPLHVFVGPDARHVGWSYLEPAPGGGSTARVVAGGRTGEPFDLVGRPTFSPDGATVAYFASRGERNFVVVGERAVAVEGRPNDPVFPANGRRVGFGTRDGNQLWWHVLPLP